MAKVELGHGACAGEVFLEVLRVGGQTKRFRDRRGIWKRHVRHDDALGCRFHGEAQRQGHAVNLRGGIYVW